MLDTFRRVPPRLGRDTLSRLGRPGRRQLLGLLALAAPVAWLSWRQAPWQEWTADLSTDVGERRSVDLADGTRLVLNTGSAVNVAFGAQQRRLTLLAGEILITTGRDPSPMPRPFIVATAQGSVHALGTRFMVRHLDGAIRVAVFEDAVEVRPNGSGQVALLRAGEQMLFTAQALRPVQPVEASAALWEKGMLLARDMPLGELVNELARHHRGRLRCDPGVAALPVSGAFSLSDVAASLALLEQTLPLRIARTTPYWITVKAR